ncbi:HAD family hydrolase (plasmid) [Streptomyces sp. NBC_01387]|uniref:HAD family hydrolase n=1 Tax=unclassified Streptomyces TaxID=2593676 RepID=UPI00202490BD|nr:MULTISPECIES: HAD family hydrolase [unclassified Streptomyces]MCX4554440.1 HAD family hydrolase [Streptomyces sp. NBC_01500]WSC25182.1 HAD family hydrolase [Streptomyces sp. NBC_01766]WSV58942.1 HAD family hydrolase [Streptomyces sp. NBC_01014]
MKRAALFDLDGVLADSHHAFRLTLAGFATFHLGRRITIADLPTDVAIAPRDHVLAALGVTEPLDEEGWDAATATATLTARVFPYVVPVLTELRAAGWATGIVTARTQRRVPWLLGDDIRSLMDVIICSDEAPLKPAPDGIFLALDRLAVPPDQAVFIGDMRADVLAGQAAGVHTIGAGWGFTPPEQLADAGADLVLNDPGQLVPTLLKWADAGQPTGHRKRS